MKETIDFVLTWVDGNDPKWRSEMLSYRLQGEKKEVSAVDNAASVNRYRDWDLLRFWFRGVENFAPWVNKIYFVTCGQKPEWLKADHPKLVLVDHKEFIPAEFLPTFNSNTIEMHLHRIAGLSERFVNFNDDMFLTARVDPSDFFQGNKACEPAILSVISPEVIWDMFPHVLVNNISLINTFFNKKEVLKKNRGLFYSRKYGKSLLKNLYLTPGKYFSGFKDAHLPSPYFKQSFVDVWNAAGEELYKASLHKFRSPEDYSEWAVKYWQFCDGRTIPRSLAFGSCYQLGRDQGYCEAIREGKQKAVCLNDSYSDLFSFEEEQKKLKDSFEQLLPEKCSFEIS